MHRRTYAFTAALVASMVVAAAVFGCAPQVPTPPTATTAEAGDEETIDADRIEELQRSSNPFDLAELTEVAYSSSDTDTRERAVLALADRAMREGRTEEVLHVLQEITHDESSQVRSAAYASLDLLRDVDPPPTRGQLWILVEGELKQGSEIAAVLIASSAADAYEAKIGISKIIGEPGGIQLESHRSIRFPLDAGQSKGGPFNMRLEKEGMYIISCELKLTFDMLEQEVIEREIHLVVGKESGTYEIVAPVQLRDEMQ